MVHCTRGAEGGVHGKGVQEEHGRRSCAVVGGLFVGAALDLWCKTEPAGGKQLTGCQLDPGGYTVITVITVIAVITCAASWPARDTRFHCKHMCG